MQKNFESLQKKVSQASEVEFVYCLLQRGQDVMVWESLSCSVEFMHITFMSIFQSCFSELFETSGNTIGHDQLNFPI